MAEIFFLAKAGQVRLESCYGCHGDELSVTRTGQSSLFL